MTKNRAFRALNYIGADLIERSEQPEPSEPSRRSRAGLWTKSVAVAACAAIVIGGGYTVYRNRYRFIPICGGYEYQHQNLFPSEYIFPIAFQSETSDFPLDEVRITVSFGWNAADRDYFRETHDFHEIRLLVLDDKKKEGWDDFNKYTVRTLDNEELCSDAYFVSEKYDRQLIREFEHSETVTVPAEIFDQPYGSFCFAIGCSYTFYKDDPDRRLEKGYRIRGLSGDIFYKVQGNRVIVSTDPRLIPGNGGTVLYGE